MKKVLKKLGSPSAFCHYKYHLTAECIVEQTKLSKPRLSLVTGCLLDRNLFWATTRTYENTSITELKSIIQAEKMQLPPMEGKFYWSIEALSNNQFTISYFVVPQNVLDKVPSECRLIVPLYSSAGEAQVQPLLIKHNVEKVDFSSHANALSWLNLSGLFGLNNQAFSKPEKLSNRKLLIAIISLLSATAIFLSAYLMLATSYYTGKKLQNEAAVTEVLSGRQATNQELTLASGLIEFLATNPNVLDKLSQVSLKDDDVFIERVKLIPTGVELFGTTQGSATKILEQIINAESIKEAKFSRAVTKNKQGLETFTIEVTWK
ncbi:hypothetical protein OIZ54_08090 [Pseudoalteromonas sp. A3]|uniref:hypothetical protein n=1 Tax=Pseudoalteromonas sp. A3 TaxID=142792 RepID=UPI00221ECECB|nr:hypothetical protein [Pseudoalteromonas sp. A3]MCW1718712.1 hypothetical protein [Pseudoalteromonas sp. A3]